MRVYLIATPESEAEGGELAQLLKRRGVVVRQEYGKFGFPQPMPGEITLALWSRASMMSIKRMAMTNRAIDAWEKDELVMVRLEHGLSPHGLGDLDMIDLTFAAARVHNVSKVVDALRAIEQRRQQELAQRAIESASDDSSGSGEISQPPVEEAPARAPPEVIVQRAQRANIGGLLLLVLGLAVLAAGIAGVSLGGGGVTSPVTLGVLGLGGALLLAALALRPRRQSASVQSKKRAATEPAAQAVPASQPTPASEPAIFVSYAHANSATVWPLTSELEADGVSIWIDRDDIKAGQGWAGTIVRAIKQSGQFCLMCSAEAFASDHVRREIYLADKYGKPMLPVRLDDAQMPEDIEYFLIDRQWVDLVGMDMAGQMSALKALFQGDATA